MKDKDKFDQVAKEVVKRGYCINDTTIITDTKDSVVYKDSIIERITSVPCKDFDTTIGRARIRVSSGILTYSSKDSIVYRIKTIINNIRDKKIESILKQDIQSRDSAILSQKGIVFDLRNANLDLMEKNRKLMLRLWLLMIGGFVITFRKPLIKMIWPYLE
jgi:hypothetical protein